MEPSKPLSEIYYIAKVDLDVKPPANWLQDWIRTRVAILNALNLTTQKINQTETEKGHHFWFHLNQKVDFPTLMKIQFLLGDDHSRVYFSQQRLGFKRFRDKFNLLFSKKLKVDEDE